ncbi:MAG: hypothetical protein GY832_26635, partial [Chloroflexi bacterium]|nr:hypothetical protein [Chloroflexota bacterium]
HPPQQTKAPIQARIPERHSSLVPQRPDAPEHTPPPRIPPPLAQGNKPTHHLARTGGDDEGADGSASAAEAMSKSGRFLWQSVGQGSFPGLLTGRKRGEPRDRPSISAVASDIHKPAITATRPATYKLRIVDIGPDFNLSIHWSAIEEADTVLLIFMPEKVILNVCNTLITSKEVVKFLGGKVTILGALPLAPYEARLAINTSAPSVLEKELGVVQALKALKEATDWSNKEIDWQDIISRSYADRLLALLEEPDKIQIEGVASGNPLTEGHVCQSRTAGTTPEERIAVIEKATKEELTADQTRHVAEAVAATPGASST